MTFFEDHTEGRYNNIGNLCGAFGSSECFTIKVWNTFVKKEEEATWWEKNQWHNNTLKKKTVIKITVRCTHVCKHVHTHTMTELFGQGLGEGCGGKETGVITDQNTV